MAYEQETVMPYRDKAGSKAEQVEVMFNDIAPTYDLLNHTLSLGIDRGWRRKAIDELGQYRPQCILDIATGTGDFAILSAQRLSPQRLVGADISEGMMEVGRKKVAELGLQDVISFQREDCMNLSFPEGTFDAVTSAYGVRNFQDLETGLREMYRVLRDGGHLLIVELTTPPRFPMRQLFWLYSRVFMPAVGWLISHNDKAYTYLPASMAAFPQGEVMEQILTEIGFRSIQWRRFTFGLSTMYLCEK
ncbi:MAG: bifunctional demethylmenaquinone methyltransferase/2-methoxy-6-polyprenyl-1,4-benzoquinol methylase UbiE [Bacteroidaceae bacterium]|nr:bifunctional demethylmenaquinone methyltransferase/2-methoxy-6-polyprenyl-1,4-benzoquinol methylase UbiE [Bacteroidaceae bacterium]